MVAYSFKARFALPIIDETKGGTIRANRRRHARPGEELQLYTGMRTRQCRLIARKTCIAVEPVELLMGIFHPAVHFSGRCQHLAGAAKLDAFACFDGFDDWADMKAFWRKTHEASHFQGWHIRWMKLPAILEAA